LVSFDVTFNTNENMVRPFPLFNDAYKKIHSLEHWNYCLQCILCNSQLYTPWRCLTNGKMEYLLCNPFSLEKVEKMIFTQFSNHGHMSSHWMPNTINIDNVQVEINFLRCKV
jgi:hypothetical protein